jgi:predicted DNA-binding transcriptional regulator AlpA
MSRPQLLDTDQAAEFLGLSPTTLVTWRSTQRYDLPFVKIGASVRYDEADLVAFIESRKQRISAEER